MNWAPVVYGRTAAADTWWQAIPEGADDSGWLVGVVRAVFAGGSELDASPRFLLAQDPADRIVGIACRARNLSDRMCSDGHRELSCFVGWMTSRSAGAESGAPEGPVLADLQERYARWAAPVYEEVMSPVWKLPHSPYRRPVATHPVAAPWDEAVHYGFAEHVPRPAEGLWAAPAWPHVWAAALATADPFTCVVGWQHARSARREDVTHLGAADAPLREAPLAPALVVLAPWPPKADDLESVAPPGLVDEPAPSPAEDSPTQDSPDLTNDGPAGLPVPALLASVRRLSASARREISARLPASVLRRASARLPGRLRPVSRRVMFGAIIALAATVIAIVAIVIAGSSPPQPPTAVSVTVSRAAKPSRDAWFVYRNGVLEPGQRMRGMAPWTDASPASPGSCITRLRTVATDKPVMPHRGQKLCVEFTGQPARYGIADIKTVTATSVEITVLIWP